MRAKLEILYNIFILAKSLPSQATREFKVGYLKMSITENVVIEGIVF